MKKLITILFTFLCFSCNKVYYVETFNGTIEIYHKDTILKYEDVLIKENILTYSNSKLVKMYTTHDINKKEYLEFYTNDGYSVIINNNIPYIIYYTVKISTCPKVK